MCQAIPEATNLSNFKKEKLSSNFSLKYLKSFPPVPAPTFIQFPKCNIACSSLIWDGIFQYPSFLYQIRCYLGHNHHVNPLSFPFKHRTSLNSFRGILTHSSPFFTIASSQMMEIIHVATSHWPLTVQHNYTLLILCDKRHLLLLLTIHVFSSIPICLDGNTVHWVSLWLAWLSC